MASPGPNPAGNDEGEGAGASLGEGALLSEPLPPTSTNKTISHLSKKLSAVTQSLHYQTLKLESKVEDVF